ncbi:DUF2927 domain-containing protein [Roseovarius salis]|uniref:DUF2927 domain-containing protein n=1 Tax=Roseovarius salis TaxID=3376063 RepID=UPI0037CB6AB0
MLVMPLFLGLGACVSAPIEDVPSRAATYAPSMPAMKAFETTNPVPPERSNRDIARDFLDLAFTLESGRALERFSRFEEPISVRVTGDAPPTLVPDLDRVLGRLRREAGIDIRRVRGGVANVTIEAVTRAEIRRHLPKAACFVVPNVSSLDAYRRARHSNRTSWTELTRRNRIAIFVPADSAPQEVRDCLHEELAQAIGPLNDLYRLPDSVFNDDNVHAVLTGFDMLILRAFYAPELKPGMTRQQVATRLPDILARLNPGGASIPPRRLPATPRSWIRAIQTALGPGAGPDTRRRAARQALEIAQDEGWRDHRLAFSHFALGRLVQSADPEHALHQFIAADAIYRQTPGTGLHRAYSASQLTAYAISQGRGAEALELLRPHLIIAKRHENAALLSTLLMLRAEALELEGRASEARAVRLDSLGWARYGFGADWAVRAKLREISALSPLNDKDG